MSKRSFSSSVCQGPSCQIVSPFPRFTIVKSKSLGLLSVVREKNSSSSLSLHVGVSSIEVPVLPSTPPAGVGVSSIDDLGVSSIDVSVLFVVVMSAPSAGPQEPSLGVVYSVNSHEPKVYDFERKHPSVSPL